MINKSCHQQGMKFNITLSILDVTMISRSHLLLQSCLTGHEKRCASVKRALAIYTREQKCLLCYCVSITAVKLWEMLLPLIHLGI